MENILTKEIANKLMSIDGEARGIHFKNDAEYILKTNGEQGLKKVQDELKRVGFPIDYKNIKNLEFYPAGLRILSLLACKKVFLWQDENIRNMCSFAVSASFIVKLYARFFYSVSRILEKSAKMWSEYWTKGKLTVKEHNPEKQYCVIEVKDFDLHPIYCRCLEGYFKGMAKIATNTKSPLSCVETKCSFKGDKAHEFLIKY